MGGFDRIAVRKEDGDAIWLGKLVCGWGVGGDEMPRGTTVNNKGGGGSIDSCKIISNMYTHISFH